MQLLTGAIAAAGALLIWYSKPRWGLMMFLAALLLYPQYLTVRLGVADFNVGRILVMVLVARLILYPLDRAAFRWSWMDTMVCAAWAGQTVAAATSTPLMEMVERQGGTAFDMLLPYFAARLIITSKDDFYFLVRGLAVVGIPLVLIGFYQAWTGHNPYATLRAHTSWGWEEQYMLVRHGLYRADASFGQYIAYGMYFALLAPVLVGHWYQTHWSRPALCAVIGFMLLGIISSMSSGPLLTVVCGFGLVMAYPMRRYTPFVLIGMVVVGTVLHFASNRGLLYIPTRLAFNSSTAYYRIGLYEEAFTGGMAGHWLFGYGYVGVSPEDQPINARAGFDWRHKDFTSIYIARLARFGLAGLLPFMAVNAMLYHALFRAYRYAERFGDRWALWCFAAGIAGANLGMLTVNILSQNIYVFWILVAVCGNLAIIFRNEWEEVDEPAPQVEASRPTPRRAGAPA